MTHSEALVYAANRLVAAAKSALEHYQRDLVGRGYSTDKRQAALDDYGRDLSRWVCFTFETIADELDRSDDRIIH